jgi:ankyrin repeat protein
MLAACILFASGCDMRSSVDRNLCRALESGDTNLLHKYLGQASANQLVRYLPTETFQTSLLNVAIRYGQIPTIESLLRMGAKPDLRDPQGDTSLQWAIARTKDNVTTQTQAKIVELLLKGGANPNLDVSRYAGYTPLMEAANSGNTAVVKCLIAAGADVNGRTGEGDSAFYFARSSEVVQLLVDAGASRTVAPGRELPAETAARLGHFDAVSALAKINWLTNSPALHPQ